MTSIPCLESDALASAVLPTIDVAQILRAQATDPALLQVETRCHSRRVRRIEPAGVFLDGGERLRHLLQSPPRALTLSTAGMLAPAKSLSFLLGAGSRVRAGAEPCDVCGRRPSCRHRAPA